MGGKGSGLDRFCQPAVVPGECCRSGRWIVATVPTPSWRPFSLPKAWHDIDCRHRFDMEGHLSGLWFWKWSTGQTGFEMSSGSGQDVDYLDYLDSARRHWEDGQILHDANRLPNADQLFGFAAECGLKAVMRALGMRLDSGGRPREKKHRRHIDGLWDVFRSFCQGRSGARYASALSANNPFLNWSVDQRYYKSSASCFDQVRVNEHRNGAQVVLNVVNVARSDGRLP